MIPHPGERAHYLSQGREAFCESCPLGGFQVRGSFGAPVHFEDELAADDAARLWVFHGITPRQRETLTNLQPVVLAC